MALMKIHAWPRLLPPMSAGITLMIAALSQNADSKSTPTL
jgi:hypothetical protein